MVVEYIRRITLLIVNSYQMLRRSNEIINAAITLKDQSETDKHIQKSSKFD